jgi:acetylserotonin N-methyltransferase
VFDLVPAIETARAFTDGAVDLIPGDFFSDPLPRADLYSLGRILHDWSEDKCVRLLDRIYAALPPGGALLIAEILMDDDRRGPVEAHVQSLNMLVCTEGRERTLAEYRDLLGRCGFRDVQGRRTGTPLDAMLALKPAT